MSDATSVSLLQRRGIEAEVLIPLIRRLERELGAERAHAIARETIEEIAREQGRLVAEALGRDDLAGFREVRDSWGGAGGDLVIETLRDDPEHLAFNVTRCRFAELYAALGAADLGFLLSCNRDFTLSEGYSSRLRLLRTQTIMQGAAYCDFRYTVEPGAEAAAVRAASDGQPSEGPAIGRPAIGGPAIGGPGGGGGRRSGVRGPAVRITLQIHEDEPLRDEVLEQIRQAIEQTGVDAEVETVTVRTDDEAKAIRCLGSPTIRVEGYDVEYGDREPPETTTGARFYATPDGWSQVPHTGMIAFAIREAQQRQPSS